MMLGMIPGHHGGRWQFTLSSRKRFVSRSPPLFTVFCLRRDLAPCPFRAPVTYRASASVPQATVTAEMQWLLSLSFDVPQHVAQTHSLVRRLKETHCCVSARGEALANRALDAFRGGGRRRSGLPGALKRQVSLVTDSPSASSGKTSVMLKKGGKDGADLPLMCGNELWRAPEVMFSGARGDSEGRGLHERILSCIDACDMDSRSLLRDNILLTGGCACTRGLSERLLLELNALQAKRTTPQNSEFRLLNNPSYKYASWIGGAMASQDDVRCPPPPAPHNNTHTHHAHANTHTPGGSWVVEPASGCRQIVHKSGVCTNQTADLKLVTKTHLTCGRVRRLSKRASRGARTGRSGAMPSAAIQTSDE